MPRLSASCRASRRLLRKNTAPACPRQVRFRAQGVRCNGRHQCGVNSAAQADHDLPEATFANVVARADHKRAGRPLRCSSRICGRMSPAPVALSKNTRSSSKDLARAATRAVGHKRDARPVEDEAVVAAHLIDVDDRNLMSAWRWPAACRGASRACRSCRARTRYSEGPYFPSRPVRLPGRGHRGAAARSSCRSRYLRKW